MDFNGSLRIMNGEWWSKNLSILCAATFGVE